MNIRQMKVEHEKAGYFFFKSMSAWDTKIETKPNKELKFITSEPNWDDSKRLYTVRQFNTETKLIDTVGEFQEFETLAEAKKHL